MGPETPLTRIREIMIGGLSLYQLAGLPTKLVAHLKGSKLLKKNSAALGYRARTISTLFSALSRRTFSRTGHSECAFPPG